jgi:DNA-binding CsgD family transcriptional regulator
MFKRLIELRKENIVIKELTEELYVNQWIDIENQIKYVDDETEIENIIRKYVGVEESISDDYEIIEKYIIKYNLSRDMYSDYIWNDIAIKTKKDGKEYVYNGFYDYLTAKAKQYGKKIAGKLKQINVDCQQFDASLLYFVFESCVEKYCNKDNNKEYTFLQYLNVAITNTFSHMIQIAKADYYKEIKSVVTLDNEEYKQKIELECNCTDTYFENKINLENVNPVNFSNRQKQVLVLLIQGYKAVEISEKLSVVKSTISKDISKIRKMLKGNNIDVSELTDEIKDDYPIYKNNSKLAYNEKTQDEINQDKVNMARNAIIRKYKNNVLYKKAMVQELNNFDFYHGVRIVRKAYKKIS